MRARNPQPQNSVCKSHPMDGNINSWNLIAREYDALITRGDFFREQLLNPAINALLPYLSGKRILDAGCGQGYLSDAMHKKGASVVGVDASENLIALAKEHYKESDTLAFYMHDLRSPLKFFDGSFDGVVSNMVLMDFDPIDGAVLELGRITKAGGFFIFSILHPFFVSGVVRKNFAEILQGQLPHYELSQYTTQFRKDWRVQGVSHETEVYHRPLEYYSRILHSAGFYISDIREPVFSMHSVAEKGSSAKLLTEIPMFLVVRAEKMPTH
jgi:2-polyprenyl-3-methyl-5-hydroxy-6-metoxy-1,4-benzoquinol methylase